MDFEKVYYHITEDKLYHEYYHTTVGVFFVRYEDYLNTKGLFSFKSVLVGDRPMHQYKILNKQDFFLTKIKYGM